MVNMVKSLVAGLLSCLVAGCSATPQQPRSNPAATPQQPIEAHIRTLAADDMEGRGLGTAGVSRSAAYIEKELRAAGLKPAFGKSYRQPEVPGEDGRRARTGQHPRRFGQR
jgi:hypothetical protein